jgi:DNA-binding NarL/FixJ family response regulator
MTITHDTDARQAVITDAQAKVLRQFMRDGATNAEIATRMFLTEHTVKCHMKQLLRRTGCASRTALAIDLFRERVTVHVEER